MILLLDNYDSFVYNLARYVRELGEAPLVRRHDAIQVDEIDPRTRTGWSVLGVGEANEGVHPDRLAELADLSDPWVDDHDAHTISISLQIISGRRLERVASTQAEARASS